MNTDNQWPDQAGPVGLHLQPKLNQRSLHTQSDSNERTLHASARCMDVNDLPAEGMCVCAHVQPFMCM